MTASPKILVIDDEQDFLRAATLTLRMNGYTGITTQSCGAEAMKLLATEPFDLILLDIMMPDASGRDMLPVMTAQHPDTPVIMVTAINDVDVAVECMRAGAFDYLVKPVDKARLLATVQKALEFHELKAENRRLSESFLDTGEVRAAAFNPIIAKSECIHSIFRYIGAIAPTSMPVLVTGETGTGKELFARSVHEASGRTGNFVAVNVAGLDDALLSDALFGHERGAFTGAEKPREGLIAKAGNGTLFLDEIGDLRIESQVKLLRLLEERTYFPVGADTMRRATCRVVVATTVDLQKAVTEGKFRRDLYFRLKSHTVKVPPLRGHKEDIPLLLTHFIAMAAGEIGKPVPSFPPQLVQLLGTYTFPGNIRELRGMVYDAVSRHAGGVLSMDVFSEHMSAEMADFPELQAEPAPFAMGEKLPTLKEADDILVAEALRRSGNNQSLAARLLGITPSALNKRLNKG